MCSLSFLSVIWALCMYTMISNAFSNAQRNGFCSWLSLLFYIIVIYSLSSTPNHMFMFAHTLLSLRVALDMVLHRDGPSHDVVTGTILSTQAREERKLMSPCMHPKWKSIIP